MGILIWYFTGQQVLIETAISFGSSKAVWERRLIFVGAALELIAEFAFLIVHFGHVTLPYF